ncbi:MAG: DarT ssDNA thymidine ADP-ribosyltransferase family protein [Chloroflexia bacterium]
MSEDQEQIKAAVEAKGITRLCHFTQARKLPHILTNLGGLWSVQYLTENAPDLLDYVDRNRFDGRLNHICCSIEYPNTWYLDRVRYQDPLFRDWVILFLSRTLIWKEGSLFSRRNAAAMSGALIAPGYRSFMELYTPAVTGSGGRVWRRTESMLPACPTDGQAEVLVESHIPLTLIEGIAVANESAATTELKRLSFIPGVPEIRWIVAPSLFDGSWSPMVKQGRRPQETVYLEPEV